MNPIEMLKEDQSKIIKSCYDAGVWGPFFRGLIWKVNVISTYAGPSVETLCVISKHWPNLSSQDFISEYKSAFDYVKGAKDAQILISSIGAVNSVLYWTIHYLCAADTSGDEEMISLFKEWIPYEKEEVIATQENYLHLYECWLKQL